MEDSCDVIDVDEYTTKKFLDRFKLVEFCEVPFRVNKIEKLNQYRGMHFEEYDVDIELSSLIFNITIIVSQYEKDQFIRKISIKVSDDRFNDELQSCINHVQRRRNLKYAIEQLVSYANLFEQRQRLLKYFLDTTNRQIKICHDDSEGFIIEYFNPTTNYLYFKAKWKIWWNCRNFTFFDYINFGVNKENQHFYDNVRNYMVQILEPSSDYEKKLTNWTHILNLVRLDVCVDVLCQTVTVISGELTVHNNNFDFIDRPIEISDSDSDLELWMTDDEDDDVAFVQNVGDIPDSMWC